jgi:hypothetical protein
MSSIHQYYLRDLGFLLRERAIEARIADGTSSDPFLSGVAYAYYEMMSLLENQAAAFDLPAEDVGLENFDVDAQLLRPRQKGGTS